MADFCKQCSMAHFGEYRGDLAGLLAIELSVPGIVALALCEGCGPIEVDAEGNCVSRDCPEHGEKK